MTFNKNHPVPREHTNKKLAIIGLIILLALIALIAKIYSIQDQYSDEYNQRILSQQHYDSREIPYRRGDIIDRNGTYLASSTMVYNLIIDASQIMSDQDDYLEPTINLLNEVYGYSRDDLRELILSDPESQYVRYEKYMSYDDMMKFEDRKAEVNAEYKENVDTHRVYGVWFEESYLRYYPNNSLACNVIGFADSEGREGYGGIEQYYNDYLCGRSGREYGYLNDDSSLERVIKEAEDGDTIVSTIDSNIQTIVEKYIARFQEELGSKTTAVVVMNPKTGEVLAMADNRSYDLNDPRDLSEYYTEEELAAMTDEETADAWNQMWRNFCVSDTYEPGSTSKIFTVSAALEQGSITGNETYVCDGYQEVGGWHIKCNKVIGHGLLTVQESLMQSCNDAMMQIVAGLGKERFCQFLSLFGFGKKTDIDLPGEPDTSSLVYTPGKMRPSDLATNSFGQNYNCTMIQMASAYCSIINGGSYYKPHVVSRILDPNGAVVKEVEPELVCETVSESTSEFIRESLLRTVNEGTGGGAQIVGYSIAGKTGTAEKYPRGQGNYLVSFCGFAPADDPQVLCYVIVDEPNTEDQPHSSFASGIFRNIMSEILPYMNIFRENDDSSYETTELYSPDAVKKVDGDESIDTGSADTSNQANAAGGAAASESTGSNNQTQKQEQDQDNGSENNETRQQVYEREENVQQAEDADNIPGTPAGGGQSETVVDPNTGMNAELVPAL